MTAHQLYTASRLRVLRTCLRAHYYRYGLELAGVETDSMRFGTVSHRALEYWYIAWRDGADRLPAALAQIDAADVSDVDRIRLRTLVTAYEARWGSQPWEVLGVEVEFRFMLGDHVIAGKIDAIIRDVTNNTVWVVEHKTTSTDAAPGSAYWERLALDSQVSIYIDGAAMLGYEVAGCIYDVIRRPRIDRLPATPVESRRYTLGKGCKACGGSAGGKRGVVRGRGTYEVVGPAAGQRIENPCADCNATGWTEEPKLYEKQRAEDEPLDAFAERLIETIADAPDDYLIRGQVVRLDDELPAMRQDVIDAIELAERGLTPRNPEACLRYGRLCDYFPICAGRSSVDDHPRARAHAELAAGNP